MLAILISLFGITLHSSKVYADENDWLIAGYGVAAFVDGTTSAYGFGKGDVHEANPVLAPLEKQPLYFGLAKGTMHGIIIYFLLKYKESHERIVKWTSSILLAAQVAVDTNNVIVTRRVSF